MTYSLYDGSGRGPPPRRADQETGGAVLDLDDLGRDEGGRLGPRPGKGAVLHQSSGEADFDGLPGDELPGREAVKRKLTEDSPAPPERSAD